MSAYEIATDLFYMVKNGEDGTVTTEDGGVLPTKGYYVGGEAESLIFGDAGLVDRGELAWWIGNNPAEYYGVWEDTDNGKIYFDAVTHVSYRYTALDLAKVRGEIAIWDIQAEQEVRVGKVV